MQIHGLNAVVTGGGSGLGEATARALASAGATVTLLDLARSRGQEIAEELGPAVRFAETADLGSLHRAAVDAAVTLASRADEGGLIFVRVFGSWFFPAS